MLLVAVLAVGLVVVAVAEEGRREGGERVGVAIRMDDPMIFDIVVKLAKMVQAWKCRGEY